MLSGSRFGDPPANASNRLYKNNRDGTFTDVTEKAGSVPHRLCIRRDRGRLQQRRLRGPVHHVLGPERLYRNNGNGTFTDVTKEAGLLNPQPRFGSGCTFWTTTATARLDLFVSNYLVFDMSYGAARGRIQELQCRRRTFCGPRGLPYGHHSLYHNNGDGTFTDVTEASGIGKADGGYGLTGGRRRFR